MIKKFNEFANESVRSMMIPKSQKDILKDIEDMNLNKENTNNRLSYVIKHNITDLFLEIVDNIESSFNEYYSEEIGDEYNDPTEDPDFIDIFDHYCTTRYGIDIRELFLNSILWTPVGSDIIKRFIKILGVNDNVAYDIAKIINFMSNLAEELEEKNPNKTVYLDDSFTYDCEKDSLLYCIQIYEKDSGVGYVVGLSVDKLYDSSYFVSNEETGSFQYCTKTEMVETLKTNGYNL